MQKSRKITLDSSAHLSLKKRISHRLEKRFEQLSPKEVSFLQTLAYDFADDRDWLSEKQLDWLISILVRTAEKSDI